jgi:hypothetical protein
VTLHCQLISGQLVLTWRTGALQSAPTVAGPYTAIVGASSPYTNMPSGDQQYFSVKVQQVIVSNRPDSLTNPG